MPERLDNFIMHRTPTPDRPLQGQTVLVVDDSRFASEAMRLLCLRSGARVRRADSLKSAARHLGTYRPSVLLVDLGLPDGSGLALIRGAVLAEAPIPVVLAISGDPELSEQAMAAGAHGFLEKPLTSLAEFQEAVLAQVPAEARPRGHRPLSQDRIAPDRMALQDDLTRVSRALARGADAGNAAYIAQFVEGVARSAGDTDLIDAARALGRAGQTSHETGDALKRMAGLVDARLEQRAVV